MHNIVKHRTVDLAPVRARIEARSQTPEYQANLEIISDLISQIREKVIAVDLDGTLYCTNLHDSLSKNGLFNYDIEMNSRIRRPYANELLQIMAANTAIKTIAWTGSTKKMAKRRIETSGLVIPQTIEIVTIDEYRQIILTYPEIAEQLNKGDEDKIDSSKFEKGTIKIPRILGVDLLLDDFCQHDIHVSQRLYGEQEANRFLLINQFRLKSEEELAAAHSDTGLVTAVKKLHQRLTA